jgi:hypothetical protein
MQIHPEPMLLKTYSNTFSRILFSVSGATWMLDSNRLVLRNISTNSRFEGETYMNVTPVAHAVKKKSHFCYIRGRGVPKDLGISGLITLPTFKAL